jgi:Protein of unknown function (DUF3667)
MDELGAIGETAGAVAVEMAVAALLERGGKVGPCTNCASPMMGAYCGVCGQPVETHRRSVFTLLHDFVKDIASFDSRILRTARALLFQPGELSLAFREGRTQRYVPAVRLYLFVTLIFFLTLSFAGIAILQLALMSTSQRFVQDKNHNVFVVKNGIREPVPGFKADDKGNVYLGNPALGHKVVSGMKADGQLTETVATQPHFFARFGSVKPGHAPAKVLADMDQELKKASAKKSGFSAWINEHVTRMFKVLATDPAAINGPLTTWIPRALFILLPLFALLLAAFYWRQRHEFFFVDHLVFSLNMHTFGFALLLIAAGLAQILSGGIVATIAGLALAVYLFLAMKRFYRQGWFWTSAKFAAVGSIYAVIVLPAALGGIIAYSLLNL